MKGSKYYEASSIAPVLDNSIRFIEVAVCIKEPVNPDAEFITIGGSDEAIESANFQPTQKELAVEWLVSRGCTSHEAERIVLQAASGCLLNQSDGYSMFGDELFLRLRKA